MREGLFRFAATLLLFVALVDVEPALAQGVTAHVSGVVVDAGGGVVPGVTVTITNADTNRRREVMTRSDGRFVFVDVLAGPYSVSAALEGFKTARTDLSVGSTDRVDLPAESPTSSRPQTGRAAYGLAGPPLKTFPRKDAMRSGR
jgi:hypothetical protein